MALIPPDGQPLTISELAPPFRVVVFAGRDRPEQGVVVQGQQRAVQTHYPGTQKASVQFMGTKEEPIPLRGWFQDPLTLIEGGPARRVELLRGIMQAGSLCLMIWGTLIVRQGRVSQCRFEYHHALRIRYDLLFAVDQPNEAVALRPSAIGVAGAADFLAAVQAAVQQAGTVLEVARAVKTAGRLVS